MIYIDTHVAVWLYTGQVEKLSDRAQESLNENEIYVSAVVRLELQYLKEIERITANANEIVLDLSNRIGLKICDKSFNSIINRSMDLIWTRDPFDRIIVANAALNNVPLLTKDRKILDHYDKAFC